MRIPKTFVAIFTSGAALVGALLAAAPAHAQDRTPTNPLDVPPAAPAPRPTPPTVAPQGPFVPVIPRPARPGDLVVPAPVALGAPPPLASLLPASARQTGGLTEDQALARAASSAVSVRTAVAQARAADAAVSAAQLSFVPTVALSARYTRLSDITPGTIGFFNTPACLQDIPTCQADPGAFQQQVVLQQPILNQYSLVGSVRTNFTDLIGARRFNLAAAQADAEAAQASAESVERAVEVEAIVAYWDVVRARAQGELAADSAALASQRARQMEQRHAQGLVTDVEVLQAVGGERGYARLVKVADNRVKLAESNLRQLLQLPADEPVALDARLADPPAPARGSTSEATRRAVERSVDVRVARARAEAAGARASSREAALYPSLTGSFNVNYDNPNQRIFPQEERFTATWDASLQLSWSLDATLVGVAQANQLRALEAAQELAVEQAAQAVERQVIAARGNLDAALLGVESAQYVAGSAVLGARHARERFDAGVATSTELMNAEAQSLSARLELVDALVDARVADAELRRVVGEATTSRKAE